MVLELFFNLEECADEQRYKAGKNEQQAQMEKTLKVATISDAPNIAM